MYLANIHEPESPFYVRPLVVNGFITKPTYAFVSNVRSIYPPIYAASFICLESNQKDEREFEIRFNYNDRHSAIFVYSSVHPNIYKEIVCDINSRYSFKYANNNVYRIPLTRMVAWNETALISAEMRENMFLTYLLLRGVCVDVFGVIFDSLYDVVVEDLSLYKCANPEEID
jgi:hypothetical protein